MQTEPDKFPGFIKDPINAAEPTLFRRFMIVCWTLFAIAPLAFGVAYLGMGIEGWKIARLYEAAGVEDAASGYYYGMGYLRFRREICAERVRFLEQKRSGLILEDSFEIVRREQTVYAETPTMSLLKARVSWVLATAWVVELNQINNDFEWARITAVIAPLLGLLIFIWNVVCYAVNLVWNIYSNWSRPT